MTRNNEKIAVGAHAYVAVTFDEASNIIWFGVNNRVGKEWRKLLRDYNGVGLNSLLKQQ